MLFPNCSAEGKACGPLSNQSNKKNTFFGGAAILAASAGIVKIIGALFKIPLMSILPDAAYGDFNGAYNIYNLFLTISTAGLPVALSKTISEADTLGKHNQVQKIFRVGFCLFLIMGLISFLCMSVLAGPVAAMAISNPKAVYCVLALSPSVLCVCLMSAFRGYFQGHFDMGPTGVSQVIESFFKLVVGLGLTFWILSLGLQPPEFGGQMAAVGAIIGVSTGSVLGLFYMVWRYFRFRRTAPSGQDTAQATSPILAQILKLAIPITIGSSALAIVNLVDTKLVMSQLQSVFSNPAYAHLFPNLADTADAALDQARNLYGIYGKTMSLYSLPAFMMVPLTACIIPAVSAARARHNLEEGRQVSESAMRVGVLLAMPMGVGLFALGGPIIGLIAPGIDISIAGPLMSMLGLASIFVCVQVLCNAVLQANGLVNLPILTVIIGGVAKIVVNYVLVGNPNILINGAPIGTLCCFGLASLLNLIFIKRAIPHPPKYGRVFVKPLLASALMGLAAWGVHGLLAKLLLGISRFQRVDELTGLTSLSWLGGAISTAGGIGIAVVVYAVLVLALRAISKEDLALMPKGDKIAKFLRIS